MAAFPHPHVWWDEELAASRLDAIADFIAERAREGSSAYRAAFEAALVGVTAVFDATRALRDFRDGSVFSDNPDLVDAARYLDGPPISDGDLATIAGVSPGSRQGRRRLDAAAARRIAEVITAGLDAERFPWLFEREPREPSDRERDVAIRWTAGLWAVQRRATGRRTEAATRQEDAVKALLRDELGFREVERRAISALGDLGRGEFCPEASVAGIKCDVPVGLRNGRYLLIECKASSTSVNSVKRLNHEVGDKANRWREAFGAQAYTMAVLAGVFRQINLVSAQNGQHIYIVWERDLRPLADFIRAAV